MQIDGYSQLLSFKNSDPDGFDAVLCVMIVANPGTVPIGIQVPPGNQGSLTLRGVGMGGMGRPLNLAGGSNHVIAGNQFGGTANGVALPNSSGAAVTIGNQAGGSVIIGGSKDLGDRNVIGGALIGVKLIVGASAVSGACQIVHNLIGVAGDGVTAVPNTYGILLGGSGCAVVGNRIVGNIADAIYIDQGSNNVIQSNTIGNFTNGYGYANTGYGIRVGGVGSSGNVIGLSSTS